MRTGLRLVVLGMMGRCPFAGQSWLSLNWMRGLTRLGHEVWYVEDDSLWPFDPVQDASTSDCSYAVRHISRSMQQAGLPDRWAFRLAERQALCDCASCLARWSIRKPFPRDACWGLSDAELDNLYASCDALLNIGGVTSLREEHLAAPLLVYVQTDPVMYELRLANGDEHTRNAFSRYHAIVTYGENYGQADCGVPLNGVVYGRTRQPIDLDLWPMAYRPTAPLFTTIGNYRQQDNDIAYRGEVYTWSKHHEWEKILDLPRHTQQPFELAMMTGNAADRERLEAHGWRVISPYRMSLDIFGAYQDYIHGSRAELTVAKDQNVRLRSGWFSERDACYLASGKPVVAQDTGFSNVLPTGEGLFAFTTRDEALAAVEAINSNYRRHCEAARAIAMEYFAAGAIAGKLLSDLGL
jgi:hypothetical protein